MKQIKSNACLDEHVADQILIYMALAGNSKVSVAEITNHCRTNMWVIEKFLPVKFEINENKKIISVNELRV
jgi:RNA 3'-terminal phosphate cyclase